MQYISSGENLVEMGGTRTLLTLGLVPNTPYPAKRNIYRTWACVYRPEYTADEEYRTLQAKLPCWVLEEYAELAYLGHHCRGQNIDIRSTCWALVEAATCIQ